MIRLRLNKNKANEHDIHECAVSQIKFHNKVDYSRFYNRLRNPFVKAKELKLVARLKVFLKKNYEILEVGCGEGSNLYYLNNCHPDANFTGVDFSKEKISFMGRILSQMKGVVADATMLPFAAQTYDFTLMRDLLHHVNWARADVLREAVRVTKIGGHVVIIESQPDSILNKLFMLFFPEERGMKDSTIEKLRKLCSGYSYRIETCEKLYLVRACSFFLGWPKGIGRFLLYPVYGVVALVEDIIGKIRPSCRTNVIIIIDVQ